MAFVNDGFFSTIQLSASNGRIMNVNLKYDGTVTDLAEAETARAAWATDYAAVGDGVIKGYTHGVHAYNDAFAYPTSQDAEFGEAAILTCGIEGNPTKTATLTIPMPKTSVVYLDTVGPNRDIVDIQEALVAAYVDNWATGPAMISDGEKLEGNIIKGKRKGT